MSSGLGLLLVAVLAGLGSRSGIAGDPGTGGHTLVSDRLNGVHRDLTANIAPVQFGPLTLQLSSPSHTLEVLEHRLDLRPEAGSVEAATLSVRYRGRARLVADLGVGGVASRLEDEVELPLQLAVVAGRLTLAREGDGYRVTTVEVPCHLEVEVKSDLGGQLEMLCRGFSVLAFGTVDCDAVGQSLSRIELPLPEPGRSYLIAGSQLTPEERRQVDAYLNAR